MRRTCLALALVLAVAGCSGGDGREAVSGTVQLKGKVPPDGGSVQFIPLENQGTEAQPAVRGGKFEVSRENGLKPGKYRVRVSIGDGKTAVNPVDPSAPPGPGGGANIVSKELVPEDWGTKSKQEVTVVAGGRNHFEFVIP